MSGGGKMAGKWLMVLPLLVNLSTVTLQPIMTETRHIDERECCPCPDFETAGPRADSHGGVDYDFPSLDCPCRPRAGDAEGSASFLLPALRAMQPFIKEQDHKTEPKPLLQPEVGLASSVLETLRQATSDEYQEALARDAARSAVKLIESNLDPSEAVFVDTPKNKVTIFLNKQGDDMIYDDDNLPEASHIQETRCIHSPLKNVYRNGQLKLRRPTSFVEIVDISPKQTRKLKSNNIYHRDFQDMDNRIGSSNIQEQVIKSNLDHDLGSKTFKTKPKSSNLFTYNNLAKPVHQQGILRDIDHDYKQSENVQPNIHKKIKELIDNLEALSNKEKLKAPAIDLKKYFSTTTRIPPLAFIPKEKPIYKNSPKFFKDLMKLKDVELISQNAAVERSPQSNLKLQSEISRTENSKPDINHCKEDNSNFMPVYSAIRDTETSPTNVYPLIKSSINEMNKHTEQNFKPIECMASSENGDISSFIPVKDDTDYSEIELEKNFTEEQLLSNNCDGTTGHSFAQQSSSNEFQKQSWDNNNLSQGQEFEGHEEVINAEPNNENFQVELLEELDTPIVFDNSSFIQRSYLKNNDNKQSTFKNYNTISNDAVTNANTNYLQIERQSNEYFDMPQTNSENIVNDYDSQEHVSKLSNCIPEHKHCTVKSQKSNSEQQATSEDIMSSATGSGSNIFSDVNEDSSHITFKELQDKSDSILNLSECKPLSEGNENIQNNSNEGSNQSDDNWDIPNKKLALPIFETSSTEDITDLLNANSKVNIISDIDSTEEICKSSTSNEIPSNINEFDVKQTVDSDVNENSEMRAEASEPESNLKEMTSIFRNPIELNKSTFFSKAAADINNVKSKLESIFSTNEKVNASHDFNSPDDNNNESSNTNPMLATFDQFNNINNLQRMPDTLFKQTSPLSQLLLNSNKNRQAVPNYEYQPELGNSLSLLNFPLKLSRPFEDTLDPRLTFSDLSDRLRSHTENTIQNVKETLESTLKDSQSFRINSPTDSINNHNILESITDRRDEMKEKLEAIHLDLNDRFNSFQQSILDHFNVPPGGNPITNSNEKMSLSKETKFPKLNHEHSILPARVSIPKNGKNKDISSLLPKSPIVSDTVNYRNLDIKSSIQNPVLYSSTTAIPSFISRPKVLKTNIDSIPRLPNEMLSKTRHTKIPFLSEENITKMKPSLLRPGLKSNLSEEPNSSPAPLFTTNITPKSHKTNTEKLNKNDLSVDSPVNKFRKSLLQRKQNQKTRNDFIKSQQDFSTDDGLDNNGLSTTKQETFLSRIKDRRIGNGPANNEEPIIRLQSPTDTTGPSHNEASLRLVEPMKENVPYKCKLICYKES